MLNNNISEVEHRGFKNLIEPGVQREILKDMHAIDLLNGIPPSRIESLHATHAY